MGLTDVLVETPHARRQDDPDPGESYPSDANPRDRAVARRRGRSPQCRGRR
jgi:hypothetical protein